MAEVWQAADEVLGRQVAVKILHPHLAADDTFVQRFRSEAIAAARLHHPGIVAIYDTGHEHGTEAIVMELVRGETLRYELDQRGFLKPAEGVSIAAQVADALAAAHRAGLVHRDIKPANILLCSDERVMVTDFGIAKFRDDPDLTQTGTMVGTVKYLSPEQVRGDAVDGRTDIYALGVVLFETLCSRPPFTGDSPATVALARLNQTPPRPRQLRPTIPAGLDAVVVRCLQLDPADRYGSADELRAALLEPRTLQGDDDLTTSVASATTSSWVHTHPSSAAPGDPAPEPGPPPRPSHAVWIRPVVVGACILGAIALALVLLDRSDLGHRLFNWGTETAQDAVPGPPATGAPGPLTITSIASFDPEGRGAPGENDAQLRLAVDGDPNTGWFTESYDQRKFGIKSGVGVILSMESATALQDLIVESPTRGWSASIYVADQPGAALGDWGEPVTAQAGIDGGTTFDLHGRTGRNVLLWITDLGDGPPRMRAELTELSLRG